MMRKIVPRSNTNTLLGRCYTFQESARFPCAILAATTALASIRSLPTVHSFSIESQPRWRQWKKANPRLTTFRPISSLSTAASMTPEERQMTSDALAMIGEAIHAVDPQTAVRTHLKATDDGVLQASSTLFYAAQDYDEVLIVAFGKASSAMAKAAAERVRDAMPSVHMSGVVIVKDDHATQEELAYLEDCNIHVREASHPIPDERSLETAKDVMERVSSLSERTLVVCCISGGGSALFCLPKPELTLQDLQETISCLLACGMTIQEINVLRKRLEDGKGGLLAATAYPATVLTLVLSDILGDPLDLIASGPTVPDSSTWKNAWQLVQKYNLKVGDFALPPSVLSILKKGLDGELEDTPNGDHPVFSTEGRCETVLVGNNELAVNAAANEAHRRGYNPIVLGTQIEGEAQDVAGMYTAMAQHLVSQRNSPSVPYTMAPLPVALIGGGETTVTLTGSHGKGGRNQELALAAALRLNSLSLRNVVVASAGTDGTDGPTDAAGAVVDGGTVERIAQSAEDALQNHDAYNYFDFEDTAGNSALIKTGPTGTNVADVCVTLIK